MRRLACIVVLALPVLAQQTSPTGFGRMIYPGTGGPTAPTRGGTLSAPVGGAGFGRVVYPGTGAPVAIRDGGRPGFAGVAPPRAVHQTHNRSAVVPYPIFYGGGYYGAFEPPTVADYASSAPTERPPLVIINQNFQPEQISPVLRDYSNTPLPQAAARPPAPAQAFLPRDPHADDATIYQIALTDGSIFEAVGYWVEGDVLNYLTLEGVHNRATLDLVDRERSKKLNDERRVEFKLPKSAYSGSR